MAKTKYELGYDDGFTDTSYNYDPDDPMYLMGYTDGRGDAEAGLTIPNYRPVDQNFAILNDPPVGFYWTGAKRTPAPGDWYLTKNGNPKLTTEVRKNAQTRHILAPDFDACNCPSWMRVRRERNDLLGYRNKNCPIHKWVK